MVEFLMKYVWQIEDFSLSTMNIEERLNSVHHFRENFNFKFNSNIRFKVPEVNLKKKSVEEVSQLRKKRQIS